MIYILQILAIILTIYIFWYLNLNILQVSKYNIYSTKLPKAFDGYKIVHLSDLHLKEFGKNNATLISKINKISPDIIVVTGDMVCKKNTDFSVVRNLMKILSKKYKIYYCLGNHELDERFKTFKKFKEELTNMGVVFLQDKYIEIKKDGDIIRMFGMDFREKIVFRNSRKMVVRNDCNVLNSIFISLDKKMYNILLAHDALDYDIYDEFGFDLVFAGHVHGGGVRLFGKGVFSPRRTLFPKYSGGVASGKNGKCVISRGLGEHSIMIRMFNLPNLVSVTLKSK